MRSARWSGARWASPSYWGASVGALVTSRGCEGCQQNLHLKLQRLHVLLPRRLGNFQFFLHNPVHFLCGNAKRELISRAPRIQGHKLFQGTFRDKRFEESFDSCEESDITKRVNKANPPMMPPRYMQHITLYAVPSSRSDFC